MNPLLLIGVRNVTLHWRHSLAALLSITAAFFCLNVFQGYIDDLKNLYLVSYRNRSMYGDLLVTDRDQESAAAKAEPERFRISPDAQAAVRAFATAHADRIEDVVRFLTATGTVTNGKVSTIFIGQGVDTDAGARVRGKAWKWNALYGEPLDKRPNGGVVLLGQSLGRTLGCVPNPRVRAIASDGGYKPEIRPFRCDTDSIQLSTTTATGQLNAIDAQVLGLADAGYSDLDKRYIWMDIRDTSKLLDTNDVSLESMLLKNPGDTAKIKRAFEAEVGSRFPRLAIMRWQDHPSIGDLYVRTMELLGIFRNFVVIIIISISALSVLNTMTKNVSERTREIGTLLSFGYRPRHIRLIFLVESLLLCALGLALGGLLSLMATVVVNGVGFLYKAGMTAEPVPLRISLNFFVAGLSAAALWAMSGLATGLVCRRVLKKRIIECLQHV